MMRHFLRALICASLLTVTAHAHAETRSEPRENLTFKIDFDPPAGFMGSKQFSSDADRKLEFRKGHGADQSILLVIQIARVGAADVKLDAQRCLEERFAAELATKGAKTVEFKNGEVVGAGVKLMVSNMSARAEVLYACVPQPFGAVVAIFAQPQLRGEPSEMANVVRALAQIKFTNLTP